MEEVVMLDNVQKLHDSLVTHYAVVRRIDISWNASDGGPRMEVRLLDGQHGKLDEWNDWLIMGNRGGTAHQPIREIIEGVFGNRVSKYAFGSYFASFEIS